MSEHQYGGIYRGSVFDSRDPDKRGRLRLLVPAVFGAEVSGWAEPTQIPAPQYAPKLGERFWVMFEGGDINKPVFASADEVNASKIRVGSITADLMAFSPVATFAQETEPAGDLRIGDIWLQTNPLYSETRTEGIHRWDGTAWVKMPLGTGSFAPGSVTGTVITANAIVTPLIAANIVLPGYLGIGKLNPDSVVLDPNTIDLIGQKLEMSTTEGLQLTQPDGTVAVHFPVTRPDADVTVATAPRVRGVIIAEQLDVLGDTNIQSKAGKMTAESRLTLQSGLGVPSVAPTVAMTYEQVSLVGDTDRYGLHYDTSGSAAGGVHTYWTTRPGGQGWYSYISEYRKSDGVLLRDAHLNTLYGGGGGKDAWGVTRVGAYVYILWSDSGVWKLTRLNQSNLTLTTTSFMDISTAVINENPGIFYDGTHICVITTNSTSSNARIRLLKYTPNNVAAGAPATYTGVQDLDAAFLVDGRQGSLATEFGGGVAVSEADVNGGAATYWIGMYTYGSAAHQHRGVFPFNKASNGLIVPNQSFYGKGGAEVDGLSHDGTNFWSLVWNGPAIKHTNWTFTTESTVYHVGYTHHRLSPVYETAVSPRAVITLPRRAQLKVTLPALPTTGDAASDPDRTRVYINRGATEPVANGRFNGLLQSTTALTTVTRTTFNAAGAQNPAGTENPFPGGVPAQIDTVTGGFVLKGDGTGAWPAVAPPPGSVTMYAGTSIPAGWLKCDGSSKSTTTYAALFAVIGYTYGGSGASFLVPDMRGRFPIGAGTFAALGVSEGLTEANRTPRHSHPSVGVISGGSQIAAAVGNDGLSAANAFPYTAFDYIIKI